MTGNLILDFPVLKEGGDDFSTAVSYAVEAYRTGQKLEVTHTLQGQSFIRELIEGGAAKFSLMLLYRDSAERENHWCDATTLADTEATATQNIDIKFSYAPEIIPSIVILQDKDIAVGPASGLTDFWAHGASFRIPAHSRIALAEKLRFTSGDVADLLKIVHDRSLEIGEMKVIVRESAGEEETPVSLRCGDGVYDELKKADYQSISRRLGFDETQKATRAHLKDASEAVRHAIVTQALTAIYAHMQSVHIQHQQAGEEDYAPSGVLLAHLEQMQSIGLDWGDDDFNPSLAATKMLPYAVKALTGGDDDDN